jgi:hypothetical protein
LFVGVAGPVIENAAGAVVSIVIAPEHELNVPAVPAPLLARTLNE